VRLIVVFALFSILVYSVKPGDIFEAFLHARPLYLALAILLVIPNMFLQVFRWNFILCTVCPKPSLASVIRSLFGGFFLGAVSPARAGEFARGFLVPGHSRMKIASLTVLEKGLNQSMIYFFGLISLVFLLPSFFKVIPILAECMVLIILFNISRLKPHIEKLVLRFTVENTVKNSLAAFDALTVGKTGIMLFISMIFYIIYSIQFYCLFLCFTDLSFQVACKTIPVIYLVNVLLPISIGDLGVKEMASIKLLAPFGIAAGASFSASLTQNVLTFLIPSFIGGIIIATGYLKPHQEAFPSDDYTAPESGH